MGGDVDISIGDGLHTFIDLAYTRPTYFVPLLNFRYYLVIIARSGTLNGP